MRSYVPLIVAAALIVLATLGHGSWTARWQKIETPQLWAQKMDKIPVALDGWSSQDLWSLELTVAEEDFQDAQMELEKAELSGRPTRRYSDKMELAKKNLAKAKQDLKQAERMLIKAGLVRQAARQYTRLKDGIKVNVFLFCGKPGPLSVHSPDICLPGAGYAMGKRTKSEAPFGSTSSTFYTAMFSRKGVPFKKGWEATKQYRFYWAWTVNGVWSAPSSPRVKFGLQPALFKMYVTRDLQPTTLSPNNTNDATTEPCLQLLEKLIPRLQQSMFLDEK